MYKVLLVDDEYFPREALKMMIPWEQYGCMICGEAKNGTDGIEKAKELEPDIILTDINMPFMDGLDMIRELQGIMPESLFSIITGYSEFEYAKRGIELGVEDFILKPIDDQELIKTIRHMTETLDKRKEKEREIRRLKFWADKNREENRKNFMEMLLLGNGEISRQGFVCECEHLGLPLHREGGYMVCCLKINSRTYVNIAQKEWEQQVKEAMGKDGENWIFTVYYQEKGNLYIVFCGLPDVDWLQMEISSLLQKIQAAFMNQWVCTVLAGVGNYCDRYDKIPESRKIAEESVKEITVSKLIEEMMRYVHENYADPELSLKGIAENLFVNYSYLSAQFKKETGMSASQYISRFRMTKAADEFRSGKDNMIKIAGMVGYTDIKYFYRCFKKEFGITPHQYLDVLKKSQDSGEIL